MAAGDWRGWFEVMDVVNHEPDMGFQYVSPSLKCLVGYIPNERCANPTFWVEPLDSLDILFEAVKAGHGEIVDVTDPRSSERVAKNRSGE